MKDLLNDDKTISKIGDLYTLGNHRLVCGDSTDEKIVEKAIGDLNPNIMITDPPYGVNYEPEWRNKVDKGFSRPRKVNKFLNDDITDWSKSFKLFKGGIVYIWHSSLHSGEVAKSIKECGFELKSQIIWNKQHFSFSRCFYHWKHESCFYAVKKGHRQNWKGNRKQCTVWDIASLSFWGKSTDEDEITVHSTQKPIECMKRPIMNHTDENDWVYDPFLGSGTTLIAAEQCNRRCIGIEMSPFYCDTIVKRYVKFMKREGKEILIKKNNEYFDIELLESMNDG